MQKSEFDRMRALVGTHWWFAGRKHLLRALLSPRVEPDALILDAGCGTGLAEEVLSPMGAVIGLDIAAEAVAGRSCESAERLCLASVNPSPFRGETFDLVVALDIIEHIEDDEGAMREFHRITKPGGRLVVTVPAYEWLRSPHDDALGHYRRYGAPRLRRLMRDAGFRPTRITYAVAAPLPAAVVFRLLRRLLGGGSGSDMFEVPGPLNRALTALMRAEAGLLKHVNLPFGLSVVGVGIRK